MVKTRASRLRGVEVVTTIGELADIIVNPKTGEVLFFEISPTKGKQHRLPQVDGYYIIPSKCLYSVADKMVVDISKLKSFSRGVWK